MERAETKAEGGNKRSVLVREDIEKYKARQRDYRPPESFGLAGRENLGI
jgi:hypothetical protein